MDLGLMPMEGSSLWRAVACRAPQPNCRTSPVALQVLADDLDQGANGQVTYAINQSLPMTGLYHINPQTGTITTAAILDREIWSQTR